MAITTNTKISTPVLSQVEGERAKAEHAAKAAKGNRKVVAAPKAASKAASAATPFAEHEEKAQAAINDGLKDVTREQVKKVVDEARSRTAAAYLANLPANALTALEKDQTRKQKSFMDKTSVAALLGKL